MKRILCVAVLAISLSGCAAINNIFMAPYDTNEYALVNRVRTFAELGQCDREHIIALRITALELKNFSEYLPRNSKTIEMNNSLYDLTDDLYKRENPSQAYCKAKLNIIAKSAERIQQVTGSKPR